MAATKKSAEQRAAREAAEKKKTTGKSESISVAALMDEASEEDSSPAQEAQGATATVDPALISSLLSVGSSKEASEQQGQDQQLESQVVSLPPTLEFMDGTPESPKGQMFEIRFYGDGCFDCSALVPSYKKEKSPSCHFSHGNVYCPAAYHRVVFIGEKMRLVGKLKRAQASGDPNRLLGVMRLLDEVDADLKRDILSEVGMLSVPATTKQV